MAQRKDALLVLLLIAFCSSAAQSQALGILSYLKGQSDLTIAAKFVQLADAPSIFGDNPQQGIVLFAATDSAWATAAQKLGINLDPATASKSDGEKLGSIMMYNMISGAGVKVSAEGNPEALLQKQEVQTLLGAAYAQHLPITFSPWSQDESKTVATGVASNNNAVLPDPAQLGKSLVYKTDTVLLPADSSDGIPIPARRR